VTIQGSSAKATVGAPVAGFSTSPHALLLSAAEFPALMPLL
jgi:hypothetical protein